MRIAFIGDLVPGGVICEQLHTSKVSPFPSEFQILMRKFDFRVCNLESALYDGIKTKSGKTILRSSTNSIQILKMLGIDLVSLANNHIFDCGLEGFASTISLLGQHGIGFVGAGLSLDQARTPYITSNQGMKTGFLSYGAFLSESTPATQNSFGIAPIEQNMMKEDIARLRIESDYVILLLHWGEEYTSFPPIDILHKGKELLQAGADLIVSTHSHCIQGKISEHAKQAFFGIGNFLFPEYYYIPDEEKQHPVMIDPAVTRGNIDVRQYRWSIGSRISIMLAAEFRSGDYSLEYIPVYQAKRSNRIVMLKGWRRFLIRRWVSILSSLYELSDHTRTYNILRQIGNFIWSFFFHRRFSHLLITVFVKPVLVRFRLYEKAKTLRDKLKKTSLCRS